MQPPAQQDRAASHPAWEVALLFPGQGSWSQKDYLALQTNRLVEFAEGNVEVLDVPTEEHQLIVAFLYRAIMEFVTARGLGTVLFAPLRVKLWEGKFREPDVVFMLAENSLRRHGKFWDGADLVVEVVSPEDPDRDLGTKREEYARAGIPEYWIADPRDATITVLTLSSPGGPYAVAGTFGRGEQARSALLPGLEVDVERAFAEVVR